VARKPRALRPGDLIGVMAPAGPVDEERLRRGAAELEGLGFAVRLGEGILERRGFTAGSVDDRLDQLHELFEDPEVAAVACARGGAGILHLLPHLDRELLRDNPKLLLGYSDVTLLHLEMERIGLTSLHGPMVARELAEGDGAYDPASLHHALTEGPERALVAEMAAGERRGRAFGLYHAVTGVLLLPASLVTGALWQRFSPAAALLTGAALALLAASALVLFVREPAPHGNALRGAGRAKA